jgi:rhodanese-related sulfurtransferase
MGDPNPGFALVAGRAARRLKEMGFRAAALPVGLDAWKADY